ncbi:MAG: hypothetical protein OXB84_05435, partial [Halobacteriovoraceae bacterium]|nr:hypothetical protein [Halobacteriovoraceae bacterium]
GGGGGSARVSAPGGGRGKSGGRRSPRSRGGTGKAVDVAYEGGGKGQYSGGRGSSKKSSKNNKNPFANLFKKNKKGSGKSVLQFRDIAGKDAKGGSIWHMISSRYKKSDKKNRLLKYVPAKK